MASLKNAGEVPVRYENNNNNSRKIKRVKVYRMYILLANSAMSWMMGLGMILYSKMIILTLGRLQ